jgi:hypothetical protein
MTTTLRHTVLLRTSSTTRFGKFDVCPNAVDLSEEVTNPTEHQYQLFTAVKNPNPLSHGQHSMNKRQSYSRASEFQHRTFNGASVAFSRQD